MYQNENATILIIPEGEVESFEFPVDLSLAAERHGCCCPLSIPLPFGIAPFNNPLGLFSWWLLLKLPFAELLISSVTICLYGTDGSEYASSSV